MIGCPLPHRPTRLGEMRSTFPDIRAVAVASIAKTRPDGVDGMGVQGPVEFQLSRNEGSASTGVDNPAGSHLMDLFAHPHFNPILTFSAKLKINHLGWAPTVAAGFHGFLQNRFVKGRAVQLKR